MHKKNSVHGTNRLARYRLLASLLIAASAALHVGLAQAETQVRVSSFEYDAATGQLVKEVIEPDRPDSCLQTTYVYDSYGNKSGSSTQACAGASGNAIASAGTARTASSTFAAQSVSIQTSVGLSTYELPGGALPTQSTNALGQTESKTYDPRFGKIISLTGPNGLTTKWEYDGVGRKIKETRADGTYSTWAYEYCKNVSSDQPVTACPALAGTAVSAWAVTERVFDKSQYDAVAAPQSTQYFDALGRALRVQTRGFDGAGAAPAIVQDTEYDAFGRVVRKTNAYNLSLGDKVYSTFVYDQLGRVISESTPDAAASGGTATNTVAYNGLSVTATNAKGQVKTTLKNAEGKLARVTDHAGSTVTYTYDALGNLTQTNAAGSVTTLTYNQRGQKTAMVDPAMGSWQYGYNVFGELVWQRDSLSQVTTLAYDVLGRMTQRTERDLVSQWSFDRKFDASVCGAGIGKLCEAKADNGYGRIHTYDSIGRPTSTSTVLDSAASPAVTRVAYDVKSSRIASKTWPTGFKATYQYSANRYLTKVTGGGSAGFAETVSYEVLAMDAQGHVTQFKQGNEVTTVNAYESATGRLKSQVATLAGAASGNVLNRTYGYDSLSNLTARSDNAPGVGTQESFSYDNLNRLTMHTLLGGAVSPPATTQVMYDARGNIIYKSDVGRYWYDGARPNRLTNITLETAPGAQQALTGTRALSYAFDDSNAGAQNIGGTTFGNGNLVYTVSQDTANNKHIYRGETYTSFNMPLSFDYSNFVNGAASTSDRTLSFAYGPEHQRIKQQVQLSGNAPSTYSAGTTWYLNGEDSLGLSYEKEIKASGLTEHKHYVSAGDVVFAVFVSRSGSLGSQSATSISYLHHDHLGSLVAVTNASGQVVERLAYDAWGKRRFANGTTDKLDAIVGINSDRGYTMHEHLDEMGVVHMNGRVYDPLIARFMSADPFIQAPDNLQSYNRYAYVVNNPLAFTDPSGYSWWTKIRGTVVRVVAMVADAWGCGGYCSMAVSAYQGAKNGGGLKGAVKAVAISYVTAEAFSYVGSNYGAGSFASYAGHAAVGCGSAVLGGGKCGQGAASAVLGKVTTVELRGVENDVYRGIATMVAGGFGSRLTGGTFENGATTAAFGYLFNALSAKTIRSLFTTPGHHPFTRQMAIQFTDVMSDEAVDYVSRRTIGQNITWDRLDSDNPHKWSNEAGHPQYNKDALDIGKRYIDANGISKSNPMTVQQAAELELKLRQHEYNRSIQDYTNQQLRSGNIRWRGVIRGGGGSTGGPE